MEKTVKSNFLGQIMTQKFKNFDVNTDFARGRMSAEFDFEKSKMSLSDYQTILNQFEELDNKLEAMAIGKKPLSEISVSEFLQVVESGE